MVFGALLRCGREVARLQATKPLLLRFGGVRCYGAVVESEVCSNERIRNIGISAHIDSGKTTLTERVLYYTGKIDEMHEVRGKDSVGAVMDSMELERQRGITIQSAATYSSWKDTNINIIDTPGHVDFTVEVERSLLVLDGAVLVLCAVGGVQSQTMTVNRQMKRYSVPCVAFINKLDRWNASHTRTLKQMRQKLGHNAAFVQLPIGLENDFEAIIDVVQQKTLYFEGEKGSKVVEKPIPDDMLAEVKERRRDLIECLANVDEQMGELFLEETEPTVEELKAAIRRACIKRLFTPVFVGSALRNKGVQPLLDGVLEYLPCPTDMTNTALIVGKEGEKTNLDAERLDPKAPFLGLAFKLENGKYGQLTYMRIYQGMTEKGSWLVNSRTGKKLRVPRIVRMHSNNMEDVANVRAGDIAAFFGVDCSSGDSFMPLKLEPPHVPLTMESMHIADPVISLAVKPSNPIDSDKFAKGIARFTKEDPTFKVDLDEESKETIFSGMGELHLEIYVERLKREYDCPCIVGRPRVAFRETLIENVEFNFLHKKQTGGHGQYGRVIGHFEPLPKEKLNTLEFVDKTVGACIPKSYMPAIEKGLREQGAEGVVSGYPIGGVKMVLTDGVHHPVDSSDSAFNTASRNAVRQAFSKGMTVLMEPIMNVEFTFPKEYNKNVLQLVSKRRGTVTGSEVQDDYFVIYAEVPLNDMFGCSSDLRGGTQGKGEFAMEFSRYEQTMAQTQSEVFQAHAESKLSPAAAAAAATKAKKKK